MNNAIRQIIKMKNVKNKEINKKNWSISFSFKMTKEATKNKHNLVKNAFFVTNKNKLLDSEELK